MKRNNLLLFAFGLICLLAACSKETPVTGDDVKNAPAELAYISAYTEEDGTKATVDNSTALFNWTTTDNIALWDKFAGSYVVSTSTTPGTPATNATFAVDIAESNRANFAIFPASIADGANASVTGLKVTLPGEYNVTDINGDLTPCPMISANAEDKNLYFYQVAAILRFQVNNIPPSTTYLTFDFADKKVQGSFDFAGKVDGNVTPGKSYIETATASAGNNIITVKGSVSDNTVTIVSALGNTGWTDGLKLNLPVPVGDYTTVTVTAYNTAGSIFSMTRKIKVNDTWRAARRSARKVKTSLPSFNISSDKPTFSQRVQIARSNLKATSNDGWSTISWSFMEHPWSTVETNGDVNENYEGSTTMSLFGFCATGVDNTGNEPTWIRFAPNTTVKSDLGTSDGFDKNRYGYGPALREISRQFLTTESDLKGDWGVVCTIGTDAAGTWRMLNRDELRMLLSMNTTGKDDSRWTRGGNPPYGRATVAGHQGLIIVPDYFSDPETNKWNGSNGEAFACGIGTNWTDNVYATNDGSWDAMEQAGAVFLPACGDRDGETVEAVGNEGYYQTRTLYAATHVELMGFTDATVGPSIAVRRYLGAAVRLVRDVE